MQENIIQKYKSRVKNFKVNSPDTLATVLEGWLPVKKIDFICLGKSLRESIIYSVIHSRVFLNSSIAKEDLEFLTYKVYNEEQSKHYYDILFNPITFDDGSEGIYVAFEKHINYISSNSSKLLLELMIERGISKEYYDNNTLELIDYLSRIQAIENKWY